MAKRKAPPPEPELPPTPDNDFADLERRLEEMHGQVERLLTVCELLQKKLSQLEQSHASYHPSFAKENCSKCGGIISAPTTDDCPKCGRPWRA